MPPSPDNRRKPLDLSPAGRKTLNIDRQIAERGRREQTPEKQPISELPFSWPEAYAEHIEPLEEQTTSADGTPLKAEWDPRDKEGNVLEVKEVQASPPEKEHIQPCKWKTLEGTPFLILEHYEKLGPLFDPTMNLEGTLVALTEEGKIFVQHADGTAYLLVKPPRRLSQPFLAENGTIVATNISEQLYIYSPDGRAITLHDTKGLGLGSPFMHPDGTLIAQRANGALFKRDTTGNIYTFEDPMGYHLEKPSLSRTGTLFAEQAVGELLLRDPNGNIRILKDPNRGMLLGSSMNLDGSIFTEQEGTATIIRLPNGEVYALKSLDTIGIIYQPFLAEDGTMLFSTGQGHIVQCPPRSPKQRELLTTPATAPRRTF